MKPQFDLEQMAANLLAKKDLQLLSCTPIQSLWAGYGHICRLKVEPTENSSSKSQGLAPQEQSLILKHVQPPPKAKSNKSQTVDESHIRKVLSYQVEQYFYTHLVPMMPGSIGVASCVASINSSEGNTNVTAMILTDLRTVYPLAGEKRMELNGAQTYAALEWLANFHGFWWSRDNEIRKSDLVLPPLEQSAQRGTVLLGEEDGVWLNGGYTYLATRKTEYASLLIDSDSEWSPALCSAIEPGRSSIAELAAMFLSPETGYFKARSLSGLSSQPYQTLLHGDVKSENLFTTADGNSVAFYDFQYVGLGLGTCDLAKFFTCSVPVSLLLEDVDDLYRALELPMQRGEKKLLQRYLTQVRKQSGKDYEWEVFSRHWETALVDWLRFQASWGFWGNSEWLKARVRSILSDESYVEWLKDTAGSGM